MPLRRVRGKQLSVLVVTPKGLLGGAERWLLSVVDSAERISPVIIMLQDGPLHPALRERGLAVEVVPTGASGADLARAAYHLLGRMRVHDPDVVLANGIKAATAVLGPARLLGVPSVWVRHEDSFSSTLGRLALRLADRTIVVGPPRRTDLPHHPELIAPPVLVEPLPAAEARRIVHSLGVPDDGLLRVGILARLARYKGIDTMIRALAAERAKDWRLVVVGVPDPGQPGDEQGYLDDLANSVGVEERVSWLGEVDGAGRLVSAFDAVTVPTRGGVAGYPSGEGFGMTVVEAFAAGVPVLADPRTVPALDLPGYREGVSLIDSTNSDSVSTALASLADPAHRERLGTRAAAIGARHPRPPEVAAAVTQVLTSACHRPGAGLTTGPALSVVSTVRNELAGIDSWLATLVDQLDPADEIVVVDGGSTDETLERLRYWSARENRIRVLEAPGVGISEGRNIGIGAAAHEWVVCTDAGCVPDVGWLAAFRLAAAEGSATLITGVYRAGPLDGKAWELALAAVSYPVPEELRRTTSLDRIYGRLFGRMYDARSPTGRSVAFTKAAWRAAGAYPEELATAEDVMFGKRAVAAGARAELAVDAAVTWNQRPTLRANIAMFRGYGRGDGQSGHRQLVARNLVRAAAYSVVPLIWLTSRRARPLIISAAVIYLSVPMRRALRGPRPVTTAALVPAMAAMRDLAKAVGCIDGLRQSRRAAR